MGRGGKGKREGKGKGSAEGGQGPGAFGRGSRRLSNLGQIFFINLFCENYRNCYFLFPFLPPQIKLLLPPSISPPAAFLLRLNLQLWYPSLLPHFSIPPSVLYLPSYPQSLCVSSPATAMYDAFLRKLLPLATEHRSSPRTQPRSAARLDPGGSGSCL